MPPRAKKKRAVEKAEPEQGPEPAEAKKKAKKPKAVPAPRPKPWPERCDALGHEVDFKAYPAPEEYKKMDRAMPGSGHRIFLISREKQAADTETFTVLGAKADVYKVDIGRHPSCTCMDARLRRHQCCKHHMFVMLRVLGLRPDDPRVWQRALTQAEAEQVLGGAEQTLSGVLADDRVRRAYLERTGKAAGDGAAAAEPVKQKPLDSDDCPICFDALSAKEVVVWCDTCGSNVHEKCFGMWVEQRRKDGTDPACVFCRAPWLVNKPKPRAALIKKGKVHKPSTVVNLLDVSQAHRSADLTTRGLYGPPRRGQEGGDFDDEWGDEEDEEEAIDEEDEE